MKRSSNIWKHFTKKDNSIATCNTCNHDYSFRTTLSNLTKHWVRQHGKSGDLTDASSSASDTSDGEQDNTFSTKKKKSTWNYYDVLDSDKFEATCKLCGVNVHYDAVSDLVKHVREHGVVTNESDDEDTEVQERNAHEKKTRKKSSTAWRYFKDIDAEAKIARCLLCKKNFSYNATITNLRRHIVRKHPEVASFTGDDEDGKKLIISANGQLYEVETGPHKVEEDDDDKEPIEMDTIYLEDLEDSIDQLPNTKQSSTPRKKPNVPFKRNYSKISKEQVTNRRDSCSDDELPRKKISTMGSLDYFGQYVVSLMKELPKSVSAQLQGEIIKQILTSKIALESKGPPANYEITISANNAVIEPATCTVNSNNVLETKDESLTTELEQQDT